MFIGIYTLDNKIYNYIYYKNIEGFREWHKDTFSPNTKDIKMLDFTIKGKTYQERKAEAIEIAKDWQNNFACYDWSYSELTTIYEYFQKVGKRYGLTKKFKENAII
jgi:hypothetical protein